MEYPKPIMNRKELMTMGFTETYLMRAFASRGQTFAARADPLNKKSAILFDTAGFEQWRLDDIRKQQKSIPGRRT